MKRFLTKYVAFAAVAMAMALLGSSAQAGPLGVVTEADGSTPSPLKPKPTATVSKSVAGLATIDFTKGPAGAVATQTVNGVIGVSPIGSIAVTQSALQFTITGSAPAGGGVTNYTVAPAGLSGSGTMTFSDGSKSVTFTLSVTSATSSVVTVGKTQSATLTVLGNIVLTGPGANLTNYDYNPFLTGGTFSIGISASGANADFANILAAGKSGNYKNAVNGVFSNISATSVPEPASIGLLGVGSLLLGWYGRRKLMVA